MAENKNSLPVESEIAKQLRKIAGDLWGKTDTAPVAALSAVMYATDNM